MLIGGSYIGCEVAASLTMLGKQLHDRDAGGGRRSNAASARTAGRFFQDVLEEHGVEVHGGDELERFEGDGERVSAVVTESGLELEADAVVIGAGVMPDVMLAKRAGPRDRRARRRALRLAPARPPRAGVFAAGDICEYDSRVHGGRMRIEHWDVAFNHGKTAALNMLGRDVAPRRRARTSSPTSPTGPRWSTSARRTSGTRRSCAARSTTASSRSGT